MAVYDENTVCSFCNKSLVQNYIGLSWFIEDLPEEIWQYGDSVVHVDCFDNWEHRLQFSRAAFNLHISQWEDAPALGYILLKSENYMLVCGGIASQFSDKTPNYTRIFLRDWDLSFHTYSDMWDTFINSDYTSKLEGLSPKSKREITSILEEIREQIPDIQSLRSKFQQKMRESASD